MGGGWGGFGRLSTFFALKMGAYSRWVLIPGRALIRINTVVQEFFSLMNKKKKKRKPCSQGAKQRDI